MQVARNIPIIGSSGWQIKVSRVVRPASSKATGSTVAGFLQSPRNDLRKRSVVASVRSEFSRVELRSVASECVLSPKNTLPRVFQNLRRAVRAKMSVRIAGRFAASLSVASVESVAFPSFAYPSVEYPGVACVASKRWPSARPFLVPGPATLQ